MQAAAASGGRCHYHLLGARCSTMRSVRSVDKRSTAQRRSSGAHACRRPQPRCPLLPPRPPFVAHCCSHAAAPRCGPLGRRLPRDEPHCGTAGPPPRSSLRLGRRRPSGTGCGEPWAAEMRLQGLPACCCATTASSDAMQRRSEGSGHRAVQPRDLPDQTLLSSCHPPSAPPRNLTLAEQLLCACKPLPHHQ